jgi:hypothetical protein
MNAKSRCDLQRPHCGRCQTRSLECEFQQENGVVILPQPSVKDTAVRDLQQHDQSESCDSAHDDFSTSPLAPLFDSVVQAPSLSSCSIATEHSPKTVLKHWDIVPDDIASELVTSRQRSQIILGTPHGIPSTDTLARHTMFFVIRVLKSWTRMMASAHTSRFPPMIHHLQLTHGLPLPLSYCYALVKMWYGQENGNRDYVSDLIIKEVKRLLHEVCICHQFTIHADVVPASIL